MTGHIESFVKIAKAYVGAAQTAAMAFIKIMDAPAGARRRPPAPRLTVVRRACADATCRGFGRCPGSGWLGLTRAYLLGGFTTLRELGSMDPAWPAVDLRNAIDVGLVDGPRLLVAGPCTPASPRPASK